MLNQIENKELVEDIIKELLSCSDGKYIKEIYAREGSVKNNRFTNWVSLMIVTDEDFVNESLYDCMNDIDERLYPFTLRLSSEPDDIERDNGLILFARKESK